MKCPYCQSRDSRVLESRTSDDHSAVRRRRECPDCLRRFTTYERVGEVRLYVVKKDGRREPFDRAKIVTGLRKACEKRPVASEVIEQATDEIERQVRDELIEEIPTARIGALVMEKLRALDGVAYVRFASVYKEFRDAQSFVKEVEGLAKAPARSNPGTRQTTSLFETEE